MEPSRTNPVAVLVCIRVDKENQMTNRYLDATSIAFAEGIMADVTGQNTFRVCCIGHASHLSMLLSGQRIPHRHEGTAFVIMDEPALQEPRVTTVTKLLSDPNSYRISFDRSVSEYAHAMTPDDQGLEDYQEVIEQLEHRVITGLMGTTIPEVIQVEWSEDQTLVVRWRNDDVS
jgi:hypothetical protein